jgi:hypothetical protein
VLRGKFGRGSWSRRILQTLFDTECFSVDPLQS